jgi:hypothetical protein
MCFLDGIRQFFYFAFRALEFPQNQITGRNTIMLWHVITFHPILISVHVFLKSSVELLFASTPCFRRADMLTFIFISLKQEKTWTPLCNEDSIELELCFVSHEAQCKLKDGHVVHMSETRSPNSEYRRGTWFYEHEGQKIPLEVSSSTALEALYRSRNETDPVNIYLDHLSAFHRYTVDMSTLKGARNNFDSTAPQTLILYRGVQNFGDESQKDIIGEEFKLSGDIWEDNLLKLLDSQNHRVIRGESAPDARSSDSKIDLKTFIKHLETIQPVEGAKPDCLTFFYQPSLAAVPSFYDGLGVKRSNLSFSESYPDFLLVEFQSHPATSQSALLAFPPESHRFNANDTFT